MNNSYQDDLQRQIERYTEQMMNTYHRANTVGQTGAEQMEEQAAIPAVAPAEQQAGRGSANEPEQQNNWQDTPGEIAFEEQTTQPLPQSDSIDPQQRIFMQSGQQPDETAIPLLDQAEQDQPEPEPSDSNSFPLQSDPLADRSVSEQLPQAAEQSPAFEQPERLATGRSRPHHEEDHQHDQEHHGHEDESNPPAGEYDVMPPSFDNVNDFETANPATGFLKIFVTTAQKALPVQGARCIVSRTFGSEPYIFYTVSTNQDGATQPMPLPAPVRRLSEDPNENVLPFASYDITVTKNGFLDVRLQDVAIFDGIISIQSIDLIPTGGFSFDSIRSLAEK